MSSLTRMPTDEEIRDAVPTPESIVWRRASDARLFMGSAYALLLQVSHPIVGAGVREHSSYAKDPFPRLVRTLDYVNRVIYGGEAAAAELGRQLREMHRRIKGTMPDGRTYHSLDPAAFAWVHATLIEASIESHARFGRPMDEGQRERFYLEYKRLGRVHGVRDVDLPESWIGFRAYFDAMVATTLERTAAVDELLVNLRTPARPFAFIPKPAWRIARFPASHVLVLAATGMLPPVLRERFGLAWSSFDERELSFVGFALRSTTPILPTPLRVSGPHYLRVRRLVQRRFPRLMAPH